MQEVIENLNDQVSGQVMPDAPRTVKLPSTVLRRALKLKVRMDGAEVVVQATVDAYNSMRADLQRMITEAAEDAGLVVKDTTPVDVDWDTGVVTLRP